MPGYVDLRDRFINDFRAFSVKIVNDLINALFVARNGRRRNNDRIVAPHLHLIVIARSHSGKRAHRLALASRGNDNKVFIGNVFDFFDIHHHVFGNGDLADLCRRVDDVEHASPRKSDLSSVFFGKIHDLLKTVNVRCESRHDDPSSRVVAEKPVERFADDHFTHGIPFLLDVRRFAQKKSYAFFADLRDSRDIRHLPADRRHVDLEVSRMEDDPDGGGDRKCAAARNGMIHVNKFHLEATRLDNRSRADAIELIPVDPLFLKFVLAEHQRELRSVNGNVEILQNVRKPAYVVFVSVRKENTAHSVSVLHQIGDIGYHLIDPGHFRARERKPRVDHDNVFSVLERGHVLADFPDAAEETDFQSAFIFQFSLRSDLSFC